MAALVALVLILVMIIMFLWPLGLLQHDQSFNFDNLSLIMKTFLKKQMQSQNDNSNGLNVH